MLQFGGRVSLSPLVLTLCLVCFAVRVANAASASDESWETIEILQTNDATEGDLEKTNDDSWETPVDARSEETNSVPEDHVTVLEFIAKVLGTAQHRSKMAVERARKRAALSRTIKEDAEKLLAEAETLERKIRKSELLADLMTSKENEI